MTDQNAYSKLKRKYEKLEKNFQASQRLVEKKTALLVQAENLLKRESNKCKTLKRTLENIPVMLNALDKNNRIVFWNRECEKVTGYSVDEMKLAVDPLGKLYPNPRYRSALGTEWMKRGSHFSDWEMDITCKDGTQRTVAWSNISQPFSASDDNSWVIGIDITQRKHAQAINRALFHIADAVNTTFNLDELYASIRISLSHIIDTTNFYIALYDKENNILVFPYYIDQVDQSAPEPLMATSSDSLTSDVILSKKPLFLNKEALVKRAEMNRLIGAVPQIWLGAPLIIRNEVIGVMAVQSYSNPYCYTKRDIDILTAVSNQVALAIKRKRDEEALKKSETRTRAFIDGITEAAILCNAQGKILMLNKVAAERSVKKADEFIGTDVFRLFPLGITPSPRALINRLIQTGKPVHFESQHRGSVHDNTWSPLFDDQNRVVQIAMISIDVTEKRRNESERLKVQKLKAISTLAGGIAHQFNNALFGITGNLELIQMSTADTSLVEKYLTAIAGSAERMRQLTAQLLAYAQGGKYRVKPLSLNQLIFNILNDAFYKGIDPNIRIKTHFAVNLPLVETDAIQMQMVFAGVISNALEAIDGEGYIQVQTADKFIEQSQLKGNDSVKPGKYACLTVKDNGSGMDEEAVARIFEPFFTTKFQGRGLGMAAAYGIVKNHNGFISVNSESGKGTCVTIGLPAIE
ncbi:ATP-binding protein [Desulfococcaceae bacterium HSG9]|nr:ATP-binding protein [Desulfococcaceae bacterium HSG9]